jgi:ketopantoate hydroxymethyltransferase
MQQDRIAAYKEYIADVTGGEFPNAAQSVTMDDAVLAEVWDH